MAVVNVKESWSTLQGTTHLDGTDHQRGFTVLFDGTDAPELLPILARQATGIPRKYAALHASYPFYRCTNVMARAIGLILFEVTCTYTTGEETEDPLDAPMRVSWGRRSVRLRVDKDANNQAIINSAGEPIRIERDFRLPLLRLERNELTFDGIQMGQYGDSVNADGFRGAPAGTCWLEPPLAERVIADNDTVYYRVIYEIIYNPLARDTTEITAPDRSPAYGSCIGWQWRFRDEGLRAWEEVDSVWVRDNIKDKESEPITEPVALNGSGEVQAKGAAPVWLYYQQMPSVNWAPLHLE